MKQACRRMDKYDVLNTKLQDQFHTRTGRFIPEHTRSIHSEPKKLMVMSWSDSLFCAQKWYQRIRIFPYRQWSAKLPIDAQLILRHDLTPGKLYPNLLELRLKSPDFHIVLLCHLGPRLREGWYRKLLHNLFILCQIIYTWNTYPSSTLCFIWVQMNLRGRPVTIIKFSTRTYTGNYLKPHS